MQLKTLLVAGLLALVAKAELQAFPRRVLESVLETRASLATVPSPCDEVDMGQSKSGIVGGCLFTQGLDTCIAMGAIGTPQAAGGVDKVLVHISALSQETAFATFKQQVTAANMKATSIFLSVPGPSALTSDKACQDMIAAAKQACKDLGIAFATKTRDQNAPNSAPNRQMWITKDGKVFFEGKQVS